MDTINAIADLRDALTILYYGQVVNTVCLVVVAFMAVVFVARKWN